MITYEVMTDAHLPALTNLYIDTFNAPPWNDRWTPDTAGKRLAQMLHTPDAYGLCAFKDGVVCGMVLGCDEQFYDGVMFNLRECCIRRGMQGQGFGTGMLAEFDTRLRSRGVKDIILYTSCGNGTAEFYRKQGYADCDGMVLMSKEL